MTRARRDRTLEKIGRLYLQSRKVREEMPVRHECEQRPPYASNCPDRLFSPSTWCAVCQRRQEQAETLRMIQEALDDACREHDKRRTP